MCAYTKIGRYDVIEQSSTDSENLQMRADAQQIEQTHTQIKTHEDRFENVEKINKIK